MAADPCDLDETTGPSTVRCSNCNADVEPTGRGHCPTCGRFLPSNLAAFIHGARVQRPTPEQDIERDEMLADVRRDPLATTLRELEKDYAAICILCDQVGALLATTGAFTSAGRRRAALQTYRELTGRKQSLSEAIRAAHIEGGASTPIASPITEIRRTVIRPADDGSRRFAPTPRPVSAPVAAPEPSEPGTDSRARPEADFLARGKDNYRPAPAPPTRAPSRSSQKPSENPPPSDAASRRREEILRIVEGPTPARIAEDRARATEEMFQMLGRRSPFDY